VPDELIESELFGHGKGAFTGAIAQRVGKFEEADGGTLFLDEIGDMNLRAQAKVLRAIEEGEVEPLGGGLRKIDVRIIAATNKNLEEMIASGKFRSDLFFRLNVLCIEVPPLRSRREDVPVLAQHFCNKLCEEYGKKPVSIEEEALKTMSALDLPGNARELRNLVERALITNSFSTIKADDIKPTVGSLSAMRAITKPLKDALDDFERDYIERTLTACGGNMTDAASRLGLERSHLYKKMTSLGLR
jgi:two-component system nitrogen regulation response regulator NtrX